jgi:hypothetical protein
MVRPIYTAAAEVSLVRHNRSRIQRAVKPHFAEKCKRRQALGTNAADLTSRTRGLSGFGLRSSLRYTAEKP